ncbi:MAG: DsbA family protein [Kiloniellaceae bacterium]
MTRRKILMLSVAAAGWLAAVRVGGLPRPALGEEPLFDDDRIFGEPDAPVTIIEYSSLTCPHCASFHENTLPKVNEDWIAKGKARIVYRHFPFDALGLRAASVANCIEGDRHFAFLDALFRGQKIWTRADDPIAALAQVAALAGLDRARFDSCIADQEEMDRIVARAQHGRTIYDVQSTPTFIINGRKVVGAVGYDEFNKVLEEVAAQS